MTTVAAQPGPIAAPGAPVSAAPVAGPVTVRSYTREDAEVQRNWPALADPLLESYNLRLHPNNVEPYFLNLKSRSDYIRYSLDAGGQFIGTISLRNMVPGIRIARLGIVLRADVIGSGLGGEALAVFLRIYFGSMGFEAMNLDVAAVNIRAMRCYERLGFRWVDRHWQAVEVSPDEAHLIGGRRRMPHQVRIDEGLVWVLHYDMTLTREDYRARFRIGR